MLLGMNDSRVEIRAAAGGDKAAVLGLAPRLAEGVAAWRDHAQPLAAGRRWLEDSMAAAAAGDGTVLAAIDGDTVLGVVSLRPRRHFTGELDGCPDPAHGCWRGVPRLRAGF